MPSKKWLCIGCFIATMSAACDLKNAPANSIQASSVSYEDVEAAIASASPGDTVVIPAGTATWHTTLSYSKAIHLKGSGVGRTVITHTSTGIRVTGDEGAPWMISGLEMVTANASNCIVATGGCKDFRITGCKFHNPGTMGAAVVLTFGNFNDGAEHQYGVVDSCEFIDGRIIIYAGTGEGSWKEPTNFGSSEAIYIEDCVFRRPNLNSGNVIDTNNGGRYVFRYNYVEDGYLMSHSLMNGFEEHFARGTRIVEIYENEIIATKSSYPHWAAMFLRGGTGVVYNNRITNKDGVSPFSYAVVIDNVRTYMAPDPYLGMADGTNPIDGNEEANGYPALDQIGRGQDSGVLDDPKPRYYATNRIPQRLEPMYIWNNTLNGVVQKPHVHNDCEIHIKENRDYYATPKPGYRSYQYPHRLRR